MTSKYTELSGDGEFLTVTPYGMLTDILIYGKVKVYIDYLGWFSLDTTNWQMLNKGLYKRLLKMSAYMKNIIIVGKKGK